MDVNIEIDELVMDGNVDIDDLAERIGAAAGGALPTELAMQVSQAVRAEASGGQPPTRWEPLWRPAP